MSKHPIQPLVKDDRGVIRFKENKIVRFLVDRGKNTLNEIATMGFSNEDHEQLAQLIGYSLGGFSELSYVSDETYNTAEQMSKTGQDEKDARIASLEATLAKVCEGLKIAAPAAFKIHPDDLQT